MDELRDRIARAIYTSKEFAAAAAFGVPIDAKTVCAEGIADAVIAALGMREEWMVHWPDYCVVYTLKSRAELDTATDRHGRRLVDDAAIIERRYITEWEKTP